MSDASTAVSVSALVSLGVTAVLSPLLFFFLNAREQRRKRTLDLRYMEYKEYLSALGKIAEAGRTDFEAFMRDTMGDHFTNIMQGKGDLVALNSDVREFTLRITGAFSQAKNELHGLELVASDQLLAVVQQFVALQEQFLRKTQALLHDLKAFDTNSPAASELRQLGGEAERLKSRILEMMRRELKLG